MKNCGPEGQPTSWTRWKLLESDPALANTIETVPVAKSIRVGHLRPAGQDCAATTGGKWEEVILRMES